MNPSTRASAGQDTVALRSDPATADATIIMLTGMSDHPAEDRAVGAGADLFLTKPFSPLRLLRLVDELGHGAH